MRAISYRGQLAAVVTGRSVHLASRIAGLPANDPELRMLAAMCLYSWDVDAGLVAGPYEDSTAEFYARCLLMPDEQFERFAHEPDAELARRFSGPPEPIPG